MSTSTYICGISELSKGVVSALNINLVDPTETQPIFNSI